MKSSQSPPGLFAAAVRRADPRSRAGVNPAVPETGIDHGHGNDDQAPPLPGPAPRWAPGDAATADPLELLSPGRPRNADGSERPG
jgi:hypothetical protein